jgi:xylulokinase
LAIDLGTGGPKVALVTLDGEVVACEFEPTRLDLLEGGGAEQDPDDWWRAITVAWARVRERVDVRPEQVVGVGVTAQWSGTVPVDAEGKHVHPAIIWMDSRGAPHVEVLTDGLVKIAGYGASKILAWLRKTGGAPGKSGKDPIAHILWLKNERPEVYAAAHKFLEPKDYLNARLTGKLAASYDSIILHWVTDNRDIREIKYDQGLLALAGISREQLPDLHPATEILGPLRPEVAKELGLLPSTPVITGTPDVQSAALGSGAVRDFEPHLYIGTSSWLTCHVPYKKTDILRNMASLPAPIPGRYFVANEQETAGECLDHLVDKLLFPGDALDLHGRPDDVYGLLNELAATAPVGSGGLIFTPWLYGERTPIEDHHVRAGFFNLSLSSTRAHLVRAVLEGVAYNSRWLLAAVERFVNRRFDSINVIGGGAKSDLWCQILADVLGREMRQVAEPIQANVRGVALLTALALGHLDVDALAGRVEIQHTYQPRPEAQRVYEPLFSEFLNIYRQNRRTYARLNA